MFQKVIRGCVNVVQKYLPEPLIFAIILTLVAALLAMPICHQSPLEVTAHSSGIAIKSRPYKALIMGKVTAFIRQ